MAAYCLCKHSHISFSVTLCPPVSMSLSFRLSMCVSVCPIHLLCEFIAVFEPLALRCMSVFLLKRGRGDRSSSLSSNQSHQIVLCGMLGRQSLV